jgi:ribosomal protein S12 methylthiotransferase
LKICLVSLGCPKNQVDGETMLGLLGAAGHEFASSPELADLVLVNTCAFVSDAQQESVAVLLEMAGLRARRRLRLLVATGCLAQRYPEQLLAEIPELDAVVGTGGVGRLPGLVASLASGDRTRPAVLQDAGYLPAGPSTRLLTTPPWTAYLKISEGCDNRCAYCVIPGLRGSHRSRPLADLVAEASQLAAAGVRELVLVGQDLTRWGQEQAGVEHPDRTPPLAQLITALAAIPDLRWLRLHYLHPGRVTDALLRAIAAEPKACRYLDIPAQHGDDGILSAMGRGVTAGSMLATVAQARSLMPDVAIRTSVITGFPGETPARFRRLMAFLHRMAPSWAGAFAYSREAGTPAYRMRPQVPPRTRARRRDMVMRLVQRSSARDNRRQVGRTLDMLVETTPRQAAWPGEDKRWVVSGRTYREAPGVDGQVHLSVPAAGGAPPPGAFVRASIVAAGPYDLYAVQV